MLGRDIALIMVQVCRKEFILLLLFVLESQVRNWITTKGWSEQNGTISIANQEDVIKPKNIAERISFESKWQSKSFTLIR